MSKNKKTFSNQFGCPGVRGRKETIGEGGNVNVNVPASGEVSLTPEEAREVANFIRENNNSLFFKKFFGKNEKKEYLEEVAEALVEAAEFVED